MIDNNVVIDSIENDIECLIQEYINQLDDNIDIYNNKGVINGLLKYLYNNYIGDLLNNKTYRDSNRYDIDILDKLWNIYTSIIYRYQYINPRLSIEQYSIFTNVSRDIIYKYNNGTYKGLTPKYADTVKKWRSECQAVLMGDDSVKSIFLLKACHGLSDENIKPVETIQQITSDQLPNLSINNQDQQNIVQIAQRENMEKIPQNT